MYTKQGVTVMGRVVVWNTTIGGRWVRRVKKREREK